ncbi:MAG: hypothetical protein HKN50_07585 [Gammaproteobacteria bacterium]|nr:hypothetical protein [Gammaproteobacteria bacterium]
MYNTTFLGLALLLITCSIAAGADNDQHYGSGSRIASQVVVQDRAGNPHGLTQLLARSSHNLNVIFIFGGGGLGHENTTETGGLWCPDSYADSKILRALVEKYQNRVGFISVAVPPVYHSQRLGYPERVFLDTTEHAVQYQKAKQAFIDSTEAAVANGTLPLAPYYDLDFNFLITQPQSELRRASYPQQAWHGAFRAADETQHYGVPNFWLVDNSGFIVVQPFRGNVYHGDSSNLKLEYALEDVTTAIETLLKARG